MAVSQTIDDSVPGQPNSRSRVGAETNSANRGSTPRNGGDRDSVSAVGGAGGCTRLLPTPAIACVRFNLRSWDGSQPGRALAFLAHRHVRAPSARPCLTAPHTIASTCPVINALAGVDVGGSEADGLGGVDFHHRQEALLMGLLVDLHLDVPPSSARALPARGRSRRGAPPGGTPRSASTRATPACQKPVSK